MSGTAQTIANLLAGVPTGGPAGGIHPVNIQNIVATFKPQTRVAIVTSPEYGAVGNWNGTTGTDDSAAFIAAIAAVGGGTTLAGLGTHGDGIVLVPPPPNGTAYLWTNPVICQGTSIIGMGRPSIVFSNATATNDALTFFNWANDYRPAVILDGICLLGNPNTPADRGRDLLRIGGGIRIQISNVHLVQAGRDGLHVEAIADYNYSECMTFRNVFSQNAGRDSFNITTGNTANVNYVNQTAFINCDSRGAAQYAFHIINNDTVNTANMKTSQTNWLNGELDNTGATLGTGDIVYFECSATGSGGTIENTVFQATTIERNDGSAGYGISGAKRAGIINQVYAYSTIFFRAGGLTANINLSQISVTQAI